MSRQELDEYKQQLAQIQLLLDEDPDNSEVKELKGELETLISLTEQALTDESDQRPSRGPASTGASATASPRESTPRHLQDALASDSHNDQSPRAGEAGGVSFNVGDVVMARWISGDNQYYAARIATVTGSSSNPVYSVKYLDYDATESVPLNAVKPIHEAKLRAMEAHQSSSQQHQSRKSVPAMGHLDKPAKQENGVNSISVQPPVKKQKVKSGKDEVDRGKKAWQKFADRGVKKKGVAGSGIGKSNRLGEGSMFRTPEFGGRVGVIGSGQPMSKEIGVRGKHIHARAVDQDD